MDVIFFK